MKNFIYVFVASLVMISCQNEDLATDNSSKETAKVKLVQVTDKGEILPASILARAAGSDASYALQFDSQSTYDATIKQLESMTEKERLAFVENYGLQSLQQLAVAADKELEEIGNAATNESEFRKQYTQYVEKYNNILISNKYESDDLSLYVPNGDNTSTYLINRNRRVVIGNDIQTISLNNDMSASDKAVFTAAPRSTNVYSFKNEVGGKKTNCTVTLEASSSIFAHVGCQKKMWYGWKRDNARDVIFQLSASPMYYTLPNIAGAPYQLSYVQYHSFRNDGNITFATGGIKPGNITLQGVFYVWTDMTVNVNDLVSYNNVFARYEGTYGTLGTYQLPRLDNSKAYGGSFSIKKP